MQGYLRQLTVGGIEPDSLLAEVGWTVLRVSAGLMMAFGHGLSKLPPPEQLVGLVGSLGFPAPLLFAWLAGLIEFFGGLLLAAGAFTRSSAILILLTMLVAAFMVHGGDPLFPAPGESGKEFALLYAVIMVPFAAAGAGRYSGDHLLRKRL